MEGTDLIDVAESIVDGITYVVTMLPVSTKRGFQGLWGELFYNDSHRYSRYEDSYAAGFNIHDGFAKEKADLQEIPKKENSYRTISGTFDLVTFGIAAEYKATKLFGKSAIRSNLARQFYEKVGGNLKELSGIDFNKAVQTITLKKGSIVQQWVRKGGNVGSYFTYEGADAAKLGISTEGRVLKTFELTEDVKVLQSTTKDIAGHAGGEIQLYNPELKEAAKEIIK